ncbi:NADPH2:quinone reductase [Saccharopolyspora kobensis]|uniref:NADPH2:quinone reductase n=1 Tax=Saccharopolyspora kobensis TaxID=146035 RepID=A0A1H6E1L7_9PSEU|nr:zinc-binding dehydrogenase [Saccharopolyspora kobensis]SEG91427.1 NADPH2:quinone reductase [Saccharopolyspora kobensis]SFF15464.1 NADPH2:quinone reductase [Saccharopolyspora kobensis]
MRVVEVIRFGGPEVLVPGSAPDPVAGPGQVVVDVAVASLTFVETQIRRGVDEWHERPRLPYVPGGLVAGQVGAVGDGVDREWLGRRVLAELGDTGGFAEKALAEADELFPVPDGLGLPEAAALFSDGSTAQGLVEGAAIGPGDQVLVEAAAGGVGSLLVQLAREAGARVVGAARGDRKLGVLRELGADAVVDYSAPNWAEQVLEATGGKGPDVVFDGVGGQIGRAAFGVTARGGRFSVHGASSGSATEISAEEARQRGVEVLGIEQLFDFGPHQRRWAEQMMAKAAAGTLRPLIGQTFPLERAAEAHAAVENRTAVGKTLILT